MGKFIDETGNSYGRLIVVEKAGKNKQGKFLWECLCDCGNKVTIRGDNLRNGSTQSCGCLHRERVSANNKIPMSGKRCGRLLVIEEAGKDKNGIFWKCLCDCGKDLITHGYSLRSGHTKSCGCLQRDRVRETQLLPKGQAVFNTIYYGYENGAKQRKLAWELTKEDFSFITKMNCHYCGSPPTRERTTPGWNGGYTYNGIDRINNKMGYTLNNVVPCCFLCNGMKSNLNYKKFLEHALKIVNHRSQK